MNHRLKVAIFLSILFVALCLFTILFWNDSRGGLGFTVIDMTFVLAILLLPVLIWSWIKALRGTALPKQPMSLSSFIAYFNPVLIILSWWTDSDVIKNYSFVGFLIAIYTFRTSSRVIDKTLSIVAAILALVSVIYIFIT